MSSNDSYSPRLVPQVMVSSTFTDLEAHRAALIKVIGANGLTESAMENDSAKLMDVIDSSLQMVRDSSAYIGVISKKYGQIPKCPTRNPDNLSITELEFNEAVRLRRPVLLFLMGEDHLVRTGDIEVSAAKKEKLLAFTERAKNMEAGSFVHRVYAEFNSLDEFKEKIGPSVSGLRRHLDDDGARLTARASPEDNPIPTPPAFYAEPDYIGSHTFVGRQAELETLSDWARPADSHTVLLFEAIGGNGKSMLTWEWTNHHATNVRSDWAGRFWYSFYEKGAIMADFCQRALAYMTGQPLQELRKKKTPELAKDLLRQLHDRPWLLILDGLERVLVAYHRIDAAEVLDEEINQPTDKIVNRDPCSAIRDEDDDLLRSLAAAAPSKVLVSSRLTPRVLLNTASQPIPGVRRITLPGLRPSDADELLRSCGITGNSEAIQSYLTANCDCHPLVIGVLAGLINDYLPDKGNFDAWSTDRAGGGQLDLANLDLIKRRNHILRAALAALSEKSEQLLSTLALLSESVDYPMLCALNPHLPPAPDEMKEPTKPEEYWRWNRMSDAERIELHQQFEVDVVRWKEYEQSVKARLQSAEYRDAPGKLATTVRDLEHRGLLQYDGRTKRHDLHPVVRGVAAGCLRTEAKQRYGQRVVDHFSGQSHDPYEEAETLEDVHIGLNLVRALIKIGQFQRAADVYRIDLSPALVFNLEAYAETLSLLRPFFPAGWDELPHEVNESDRAYLANQAAIALHSCGKPKDALAAYGAGVRANLETERWKGLATILRNISQYLTSQNLLAKAGRVRLFALELATLLDIESSLFMGRLFLFSQLVTVGHWEDAEATWQLLDPMGRDWPREIYRPGDAEACYAWFQFCKGKLMEEHLCVAERLANQAKNRIVIRLLFDLRGAWRVERSEWALAVASFQEAVRMTRQMGIHDVEAETGLILAKFHLGQLDDARREAEELAQAREPANRLLATLWLAIGDQDQAKKHALAAYQWAWADGEPFVNRYELTKTTALLQQLGVPIPSLPAYDPAKDEKFPWEGAVVAAIEKLRESRSEPPA